ncbi:MAG: hypothetical protein ACPGJV_12360 [Bacteriovoracaceae bacterium]
MKLMVFFVLLFPLAISAEEDKLLPETSFNELMSKIEGIENKKYFEEVKVLNRNIVDELTRLNSYCQKNYTKPRGKWMSKKAKEKLWIQKRDCLKKVDSLTESFHQKLAQKRISYLKFVYDSELEALEKSKESGEN